MKKFILITAAITMLWTGTAFAQKIEKPDKTYTAEEINERLAEGESVPFIDILYAEQNELPDLMAEPDSVTSTSFYDQLTPVEKELYNAFAEKSEATKNGTEEISVDTNINVSVDTERFMNDSDYRYSIFKEYEGIDYMTYIKRPLYAYLCMDHPEVFWIDINKLGIYTYHGCNSNLVSFRTTIRFLDETQEGPTGYTSYWPACYNSQEEVEADASAMETKIKEIISGLPENASDFCKVKYFTEWLCQNNTYNPYIDNPKETEKEEYIKKYIRYPWLAPSAFLYGSGEDTMKYPVCEGYSEAFKILCDRAGVKAMCSESIGHKWDIVKLGDRFYFCDPTWCDGDGFDGIMQYCFMLIGSEKMDALDDTDAHITNLQSNLDAPKVSDKMYIEDMGFPVYDALEYNGYRYPCPYFLYNYIDTDGNGIIDDNDIKELLYQAAEIKPQTSQDFNGNDAIDLSDVIKYMKLMFN